MGACAWIVGLLALAGVQPDTSAEPELGAIVATAPTPAAPLLPSSRARAMGTPEILYINFDGGVLQSGCGNDPHYDCSTLSHLFSGYVGPFQGDLNQRVAILQAARKDVAEFGVKVVIERPPEDTPYTMVFYGDLGPQSFAGIAPYIDCEDRRGGDSSFTQGFASSNTGSTVILQEAAHTWGLEHVNAEFDILNPFKSAGLNQSFRDECFKIVANTDLEPTSGSCNQIHTLFCDTGWQNSYQEMFMLFGPPVPDTIAPQLEVTSPPQDSAFVLPTTVSVRGEVSDDLHPQSYRLEIFDDGETIYDDQVVGLDLLFVNPPAGDYDLLLRITDEGGNTAEDRVFFTILEEGSELPDDPGGDDETDPEDADPQGVEACAVGEHPAPSPGWLALALLALPRRRRRS